MAEHGLLNETFGRGLATVAAICHIPDGEPIGHQLTACRVFGMVGPQKLFIKCVTLLLLLMLRVDISLLLFICQISEALEGLVLTDFEDSLTFLRRRNLVACCLRFNDIRVCTLLLEL